MVSYTAIITIFSSFERLKLVFSSPFRRSNPGKNYPSESRGNLVMAQVRFMFIVEELKLIEISC
jgi:hypothetical protein